MGYATATHVGPCARCTRYVHMCAVPYELAYACKSPAHRNATVVPVQWCKQRAAYTDMPKMPFVKATTRRINGEGLDYLSATSRWQKGTAATNRWLPAKWGKLD